MIIDGITSPVIGHGEEWESSAEFLQCLPGLHGFFAKDSLTYWISQSGSDNNFGLSPECPRRTIPQSLFKYRRQDVRHLETELRPGWQDDTGHPMYKHFMQTRGNEANNANT